MSIDLTPGQTRDVPDSPSVLTYAPAGSAAAPASPIRARPQRVPTHFFVATLMLYGLVLGTFLLNLTKLRHAEPNWRTLVPFGAGVSFYVASTLFLLILGRGQISRWTVLICTAATLVLTTLLCLILRAGLLVDQVPDGALRHLLIAVDHGVKSILSVDTWVGETILFAGKFTLEELIKLTPVFFLIATGRIRNAHGAMLCGALSGLTFGAVEAISFGYLVYPAAAPITPVSTYLTRFFIMSPLHGIWDALAGGLVFFLSGRWRFNTRRGPTIGSAAAAFACAVVFHVTHNALQAIVGPVMQIVTVFMLLAPLYLLAKAARKRAAAEGSPDGGQLVGDLHLFTFSLAVGFLAMSLLFSWVLGIQRA
jgi:hypothetical protein